VFQDAQREGRRHETEKFVRRQHINDSCLCENGPNRKPVLMARLENRPVPIQGKSAKSAKSVLHAFAFGGPRRASRPSTMGSAGCASA